MPTAPPGGRTPVLQVGKKGPNSAPAPPGETGPAAWGSPEAPPPRDNENQNARKGGGSILVWPLSFDLSGKRNAGRSARLQLV